MSWDKEVQELQRRRYLAQQQGGEAGIAKQHARGRMTIRERIDVLLDDGSFREHGRATASPVYDDNDELLEYVPANYVVGFGAIDGRRVTVGGEDFTLKRLAKCRGFAQKRLRRALGGAVPHSFSTYAGRWWRQR